MMKKKTKKSYFIPCADIVDVRTEGVLAASAEGENEDPGGQGHDPRPKTTFGIGFSDDSDDSDM